MQFRRPPTFPVVAIRSAIEHRAERSHDFVRLWFGNLRDFKGSLVDIHQVDTATISVGPHLIPAHVDIAFPGHEDRDREHRANAYGCPESRSEMLLLEFPRNEFLRALQQLNLDGPLKAGDKLEVKLRGRMKDGTTPLTGAATVKITGDRDDHDKDHGKELQRH